MEFAVMVWTAKHTKSRSIFALIDRDNPKKLPELSPQGHWEDYRVLDERKCPFADEAKKAIVEEGYYLMGASVTITEAFGSP